MDFYRVYYRYISHPAYEYSMSEHFLTPYQAEMWLNRWHANWRTANQFGQTLDLKFEIRAVTWKEREGYRLDEGLYRYPLWSEEKFWKDHAYAFYDHYAHVSTEDKRMVAFTLSEAHGEADRQTRMKPGKYLQRYFGGGRDGVIEDGPMKGRQAILTAKQIAYYAEWWQTGMRPPSDIVNGVTLGFATTSDEIVDVYTNSPITSCMDGRNFDRERNPTKVYGAGDLAIAYLTSASGKVIARALCWPEKKVLGRVYPTADKWSTDGFTSQDEAIEVREHLTQLLRKDGYVTLAEGGDFTGARLLKIEHRNGGYVMPYLDSDYGVDDVYGEDRDKFWKMSRSPDYSCDNTDGTICSDSDDDYDDHEDEFCCSRCDDWNHNDEATTIRTGRRPSFETLAGRQRHRFMHGTWCEYCKDNYAFYCDGTDEYYSEDDFEKVSIGYNTFERVYAEEDGAYQSDKSGNWYFESDDPKVDVNGETWSRDDAIEHAFFDHYEEAWFPLHDMSLVYPGLNLDMMDGNHCPVSVFNRRLAELAPRHSDARHYAVPTLAELGEDFRPDTLALYAAA